MNYKTIIALALVVSMPVLAPAFQNRTQAGEANIDDVVRKFAAAETENQIARNNYTFTQDFDLVTLGEAGSVTGRYKRVSDVVFDDRGVRFEKITLFPPPTALVSITKEDLQDLAGVQPFALTTDSLPKYIVSFVGKEKVDELDTFVFEVKPKQFIKGERYLQGRIWVDDQDLQIVKVAGQAVPEIDDQKFPRFESYRENIDGRYWFPTYIHADDVLEFRKGPAIRLRMTVRFTNYKKFGGRIRVLDDVEPASESEVKAAEKERPPASPAKPPVKPPIKPPTR